MNFERVKFLVKKVCPKTVAFKKIRMQKICVQINVGSKKLRFQKIFCVIIHPPDTHQTPTRHPPDTHQTISNTFQIPTRNFKHVRSVSLLKTRWGLLLPSFFLPVGKQSQLLLKPTKVELGLQVGVEFDKKREWKNGQTDTHTE